MDISIRKAIGPEADMGDLSLRMLCHSTHRQAESGDGSRKVQVDLRANELADDSINLFQMRLVVDWRLGERFVSNESLAGAGRACARIRREFTSSRS
jgi:hypothetical protein